MNKTLLSLSLCLASALSAVGAPVTINFGSVPVGPVTTIGDATFSLVGPGPAVGATPYNQSFLGLTNSPTGAYPTNTILRVDFATPASGIQFTFSPEGFNGSPTQGYTLFDSSNNVITSGLFTSGTFANYNLSLFTGVARIEWNNGTNGVTGNSGNWIQGLRSLTFDAAAVPEPASMLAWGLIAGVGAAGYRLRKRKATVVA